MITWSRRSAVGPVAGIAILVLSACGAQGSSAGASSPAPSGEALRVLGPWFDLDQQAFEEVLDAFAATRPGLEIDYVGIDDPELLAGAVRREDAPDVAIIGSPTLLAELVDEGRLVDVEFARDAVADGFPAWAAELGSVDGTLYGLLFRVEHKSLVWYNVAALGAAEAVPPADWPGFQRVAAEVTAAGIPAHAIAAGFPWVLSDIFENIYLRTAGPEAYDALTRRETPWTDPSVVEALTMMTELFDDPTEVGGGAAAAEMDLLASAQAVLSDPPSAAMAISGAFFPTLVTTTLEPGTGYDAFDFPSIDGSPPAVIGNGSLVVRMSDAAAGEQLVRFLATPEAAEIWIRQGGGFISPNRLVDPSAYPTELEGRIATSVVGAEVYRFDLSDQQPPEFGFNGESGILAGLNDLFRNPADVERVAAEIQAGAPPPAGP